VINRLNVGITGFEAVSGTRYTPSWEEVAVTISLVALGVTLFSLAIRHLPVLEKEPPLAEAFARRLASRSAAMRQPDTVVVGRN
jgi:Ni/Fe-hydrogenase subunit HybB-like protein